MSIGRIVYVTCDVCADGLGDMPARTTAEARVNAAAAGWHHTPNGDVCDRCWDEGKRVRSRAA